MSPKMSKELAKHRLEQAKENLEEAEILYNAKKFIRFINKHRGASKGVLFFIHCTQFYLRKIGTEQ